MNVSIWVAPAAALAGSVLTAALTNFVAPHMEVRRSKKQLLKRHRDPLTAAAVELQGRLYNMLRQGFIETYLDPGDDKYDAAVETTLYVIAQFFGWREIVRREVLYLEFSKDKKTAFIGQLLERINTTFATDAYGRQFMIWRAEQRGIGERMVQITDGKPECRGYASYVDNRATMNEWLDPLRRDLEQLHPVTRTRLEQVQHLLVDLVRELDPHNKLNARELRKA